MSTRNRRAPSYRLHKPSGQARVIIDGKHVYLGRFNSPESHEKYHRLVAEWLAAGKKPDAGDGHGDGIIVRPTPTVDQLILTFWRHAKRRYVKNGRPTSEVRSFKVALRPVRRLYGSEPITHFGPLALVACRQKLIEAGYCRKRINQHVGRIRRAFKWGVARELVPETVWRALCAVEGLRVGEGIERPPIRAVSDERIAAVEHFVTPQVWAMVNLQIWSACRPGEACIMRAIDINMQGKIWEYRPHSHKVEHHGKERVIFLGPHAQEIIKPWLKTDLHAYLFSPKDARAWSQAKRAKNRKTPKPRMGQKHRRKQRPKRAPGKRYTVHAYDHAIRRGCELAFGMPKELRNIPTAAKVSSGKAGMDAAERERLLGLAAAWHCKNCWHPNQLRHTAATRIRASYGIELARIILGHSSAVTSEIYAEIDREKAKEVMGKLG
jgi:site-specific recombinase XerD